MSYWYSGSVLVSYTWSVRLEPFYRNDKYFSKNIRENSNMFSWNGFISLKKITGHISQILVEGESSRGPLTLVLSSYVTTTWRIILQNVNITIPNIFLVSPFKIENDIRVFTNTQHWQQCQYEHQMLYYVNTKKHTPFWTNLLIYFWDWDFRMGGIYFKRKSNDTLASNF